MMDPFHTKYGRRLTAGLSLAPLFLDLVWVPNALIGLGTFWRYDTNVSNCKYSKYNFSDTVCLTGGIMSVILDLPFNVCTWISAGIAIIYTLLGGLYSVAYTDVIQLILILVGMVSQPKLLRKHLTAHQRA